MRQAFPLLVAGLSALTFGGVWIASGRTAQVAPARPAPVANPSDAPAPLAPEPSPQVSQPSAASPSTTPSDGISGTPTDPEPSGARSDCGDNLVVCYPPGNASVIL